jgi:NitT/TauT family transport system ATP-binding protein
MSESSTAPVGKPSAVSITGLSIRFGDETVLDDLALDVEEGEFLCLLGPSGCGKSTLLRVIGGLIPARGSVQVFGLPPREAWSQLAFVFQQARLLPWRSALSNVMLGMQLRSGRRGKAERREIALDALAKVGLENVWNRAAHVLSGGEQQRVAIARGLSVRPRILMMDEPFSALDLQTRRQLREQIVALWQETGITTIFVTHDVDEALYVGRRVVTFSPKPTRIVEDLVVDVPHPRDVRSPEMEPYRKRIINALGGLEVLD